MTISVDKAVFKAQKELLSFMKEFHITNSLAAELSNISTNMICRYRAGNRKLNMNFLIDLKCKYKSYMMKKLDTIVEKKIGCLRFKKNTKENLVEKELISFMKKFDIKCALAAELWGTTVDEINRYKAGHYKLSMDTVNTFKSKYKSYMIEKLDKINV